MHEYSLVRALLDQVDTLRREQAAERVVAIRISVGELAGVEPELFRTAYEMLVAQTPMRGAELIMDAVPLEAHCQNCEQDFRIERFRFECPHCASRQIDVLRGQDLRLESVTIDQPDASSATG